MRRSTPSNAWFWQLQSPLVGFRDTDSYSLLYPDRLHQCCKGVGLRLIELAIDRLSDDDKALVYQRLQDKRSFRAHKLSSRVFEGPATAAESAFLLQCMPPVLVGTDSPMVGLIAGRHYT